MSDDMRSLIYSITLFCLMRVIMFVIKGHW